MVMAKSPQNNYLQTNWKSVLILLVLILVLPILLLNINTIVKLFSQAALVPANISIDATDTQGALNPSWQGLSQGGELASDGKNIMSLGPTVKALKDIKVRYIRIDHVLEFPSDARIREIVDSGATPIIALSYFPRGVGTSDVGNIVSWDGWQRAVTAMVEKVSGVNGYNLPGVYYEVWNEPDGGGFGGYSIGEKKDYFTLYQKTVEAASRAQNVNPYKIGGPALADLRRCSNIRLLFVCPGGFWLDKFFELVSQNNTRLDFVSWHRYSFKMSDYNEDVNFINDLYAKYSNLPHLEKLITEWGSDPARNSIHDSYFDAVHLVAAARTFLGQVDVTTKFEVRNGPANPSGGWGIMTYDGRKKPTYEAMRLMSLLRSQRIGVNGEGTNVTGIASRDTSGMTVILSNYDKTYRNTESVPMQIINLPPGTYRLTTYKLNSSAPYGTSSAPVEVQLPDGIFTAQEVMLPNSVVMWDLQQVSL